MKTFAQAQANHLACLVGLGWTVKADLKIPHATSPTGKTRLWFKAQAVYAGRGTDFGDARSIAGGLMDTRTVTTTWLVCEGVRLAEALAADKAN